MSIATETRLASGTQTLAWAVLVAAVVEVVAPAITILGTDSTPGTGSGPELLINPAGWTFAIWGVIYALAIAQAVATVVKGGPSMPRRLQVDLLVLYLGGTLWIVMSQVDSSVATAAALLVMLVAGVDGVLVAARADVTPDWLSSLTRGSVGLYAGWVTAAFFLNLGTALVDLDVREADQLGWQIAMLFVAGVTLVGLSVAAGGIWTYAAAGAWALFGITVASALDGTYLVTTLAAVAAVALVGLTLNLRMTGRIEPGPQP